MASMTVASGGVAYLFGGNGYATTGRTSGDLGDVWAYRQTEWSRKGEWAWLGGKNDSIGYQGHYAAPTPYPGARRDRVAWQYDGLVYVHGGYGKDGMPSAYAEKLSDLWSFNPTTRMWTCLRGSSDRSSMQKATYGFKNTPTADNMPGVVYMHMLLTVQSDGIAVIFGGAGYDSSSAGILSDTWKYNKTSGWWTWISGESAVNKVSQLGASSSYQDSYHPGGRYSSAVMDSSSIVYLFGGNGYPSMGSSGILADLWAYSVVTNQWAYIAGESNTINSVGSYGLISTFSASGRPGSRWGSTGWADPYSDLVHVFGGSGYLNDFWAYNVTTNQWAWAGGDSVADRAGSYANSVWFSTSNKPGARWAQTGGEDNSIGLMYLLGGYAYPASGGVGIANDFWATKGPTIVIGASPTTTPTSWPSPSPASTATSTVNPTLSPTTTPSSSSTPSSATTPTPSSTHLYPLSWRWMSGASIINQNGVCGSAGQFDKSHTPGSRWNPAVTADSHGALYVFGGYGYATSGTAGQLGDVWVYRQTEWNQKGEWAWLGGRSDSTNYQGYYVAPTPYPGARYASVMWHSSGLLYVHGGDGMGTSGRWSDLWSFSPVTYTWTWMKGSSVVNTHATYGSKGISAVGNVPGAVSDHRFLTSVSNRTALFFGGIGYSSSNYVGFLSDIWKYDQTTNMWTWINGPSTRNQNSVGGNSGVYSVSYHPGGRQQSAIMDTTHRAGSSLVYLFGGGGYSADNTQYSRVADLWAYDVDINQWAYIAGESSGVNTAALGSYGSVSVFSATSHPGSRVGPSGCSDPHSDLICLFGGDGYAQIAANGRLSDLWSFNTTLRQWVWSGGDSLIDQIGDYADHGWFSTSNKPGTRTYHMMSVDFSLGLVYLFAGIGSTASGYGILSDMWATRGPSVVVIGASPTPSTSPTASSGASLSPTPSVSAAATATTSPTSTVTPTLTVTPSSTPSPSSTPTPTLTPTPMCPTFEDIPSPLSGTWVLVVRSCTTVRFDNKYRVTQSGGRVTAVPLVHPTAYPTLSGCVDGNGDFSIDNTTSGSCDTVSGKFKSVHNLRLACTVNGVECDAKFNCISGECLGVITASEGVVLSQNWLLLLVLFVFVVVHVSA